MSLTVLIAVIASNLATLAVTLWLARTAHREMEVRLDELTEQIVKVGDRVAASNVAARIISRSARPRIVYLTLPKQHRAQRYRSIVRP